MIEVQNLSKYFGSVAAIRDLSFTVDKGEILGFLGPNGAGKTTAMRVLTGYFPATSGAARVAGYDVFSEINQVRKKIGYLPENVPLYADMSVQGYVTMAAQVKGLGGKACRTAVDRTLEETGLKTMRKRLIKKLSRGYRQRVGLAQALVNDPEVLVLDEPTVGLDPKQITEIREIIRRMAGQRTVILSTHILPEVSIVCSRVAIVNRGRLIKSDTIENLTNAASTTSEIVLQVRGQAEAAAASIRGVGGVSKVASSALDGTDQTNLVVGLPTDPDLRGQVAKAVTDSGVELLEMRTKEITLEEVFIEAISSDVSGEETPDPVGLASSKIQPETEAN